MWKKFRRNRIRVGQILLISLFRNLHGKERNKTESGICVGD